MTGNRHPLAVLVFGVMAIALSGCDPTISPEERADFAMLKISTRTPINPELRLESHIARTPDGMIYVLSSYPDRLIRVSPDGTFAEIPTSGKIYQLARSPRGNLYGAMAQGVVQIFSDGKTKLLAGSDQPIKLVPGAIRHDLDGPGTQARFAQIGKIAADDIGNVFVMSSQLPDTTIRKIKPNGDVITLTGLIRMSETANNFAGDNFAVDSKGILYFGTLDSVVRLTSDNRVETFAGGDSAKANLDQTGTKRQQANLSVVSQIKVDGRDNVFISVVPGPFFGGVVMKISQSDGVSTVLSDQCHAIVDGPIAAQAAGCTRGLVDGPIERQIFGLDAFDIDDQGDIYFIDAKFQAIRKLTPSGMLSTIARGAPFLNPLECQALNHEPLSPPLTLPHNWTCPHQQ